MIGPSGMRVSTDGVCGDCPCFAERIITVLLASPRLLRACTIWPTFESM